MQRGHDCIGYHPRHPQDGIMVSSLAPDFVKSQIRANIAKTTFFTFCMSRDSKQRDFRAEMRVRGGLPEAVVNIIPRNGKKTTLQWTYLIEKKRLCKCGDSLMTSSGVVVMEINLPKCGTRERKTPFFVT